MAAFSLPPLPYAYDALEPWVSATTLRLHHDVLHKRYVTKLNELVGHTSMSLTELVMTSKPGPILDNASQAWNHDFLWKSMSPYSTRPSPGSGFSATLSTLQRRSPFDALVRTIVDAGTGLFGSGYVWLVVGPRGGLEVWPLPNGDNPLRLGGVPLLTIDVWEHAYLLDYGGDRNRYLRQVADKIANWEFAETNYARAFE